MSKLSVYMMPMSAPCRAVCMTLKHLNVPYDVKITNLMNGEHMTPEFLKINPQHCIPTIVDTDGFAIWESRAICAYLVNKYAPGSSLYPSDVKKRAEVDKLLYFDIGALYKSLGEVLYPVLLHGAATIDEEKDKVFRGKLDLLEGFLAKNKYVAGDELTIADLSIYSSLVTIELIDYDFSSYAKIGAWRKRLEAELPYNKEVTLDSLAEWKPIFDAKRAEAKAK